MDLGCARNAALTQTHSTVTECKICVVLGPHKQEILKRVFEHFRILLISYHRLYRARTKTCLIRSVYTFDRVVFPFLGQVGQQEGATRPKKCTKMV